MYQLRQELILRSTVYLILKKKAWVIYIIGKFVKEENKKSLENKLRSQGKENENKQNRNFLGRDMFHRGVLGRRMTSRLVSLLTVIHPPQTTSQGFLACSPHLDPSVVLFSFYSLQLCIFYFASSSLSHSEFFPPYPSLCVFICCGEEPSLIQ